MRLSAASSHPCPQPPPASGSGCRYRSTHAPREKAQDCRLRPHTCFRRHRNRQYSEASRGRAPGAGHLRKVRWHPDRLRGCRASPQPPSRRYCYRNTACKHHQWQVSPARVRVTGAAPEPVGLTVPRVDRWSRLLGSQPPAVRATAISRQVGTPQHFPGAHQRSCSSPTYCPQ